MGKASIHSIRTFSIKRKVSFAFPKKITTFETSKEIGTCKTPKRIIFHFNIRQPTFAGSRLAVFSDL
jgi:hypothetical protein